MNKTAIKKWAGTVVNPGQSYSEYDNKRPIDWDMDEFKSYIQDQLDTSDIPTSSLKMFNFPNKSLFKYYANQGTGLNGDKYWNKYENFGGAMYDLFTYLKTNIFSSVKSENKIKNSLKLKKIIESVLNELKPGQERFYIAYYATVGEHGEAGTYSNFQTAFNTAKSKLKDKDFMDGLAYVGVEPTYGGSEFAVIYATPEYLKRLSQNDFNSMEDYKSFMDVYKKVMTTKKPQVGKFE
jgi:hypothetical protein